MAIPVPRPDSLYDESTNAQGATKHPFAEPYPSGPEHHAAGSVDPDVPGGIGPHGEGRIQGAFDVVPRSGHLDRSKVKPKPINPPPGYPATTS